MPAHMIPPLPKEYDEKSEKGLVFKALKKLPDDYYVFHSVVINEVKNWKLIEREIDFVVVKSIELQNVKRQVNELKKWKHSSELNINSPEEMQRRLYIYRQENEELNLLNRQLRTQVNNMSRLEEEINKLKIEKDELNLEKDALNVEKEKIRIEKERLESKYKLLLDRKDDLHRKCNEIELENVKLKSDIKTFSAHNTENADVLRNQLQEKDSKIRSLKARLDEKDSKSLIFSMYTKK